MVKRKRFKVPKTDWVAAAQEDLTPEELAAYQLDVEAKRERSARRIARQTAKQHVKAKIERNEPCWGFDFGDPDDIARVVLLDRATGLAIHPLVYGSGLKSQRD